MLLAAGARLGPYEILAPLGAGGMGEVYRARDTRLGRDVALKVLPAIFSSDAERMARFEREAQLLASLNHPNIAALYGLEDSSGAATGGAAGGVRALVMELVEGPTLAERITSGPQAGPIPVDEALTIARQIAEALEAAHEKGIIHRDLKPANVKLTRDGVVKVLDFGLAKALDDDPATSDLRNSPTLSLAATRAGVILGTAAYMSPEQAKGKPVDRRTDIWAFGVVLMEMLAGKPIYSGETAPEILAAVMKDEPHWDALPASTPPAVRKLLRRCLDKDPKRRLRDIGEARIAIDEALSGTPAESGAQQPAAAEKTDVPRQRLPWAIATLALVAACLATWAWLRTPQPASRPVMRWTAALPMPPDRFASLALSPDGARLAYLGRNAAGGVQIYVRLMDQLEAKPLSGTEGTFGHLFSPDGQWIAYVAGGKLKKVPVTGGASITLCSVGPFRGASWGPDETIVFSRPTGGLSRVSAAGGAPQVLTTPDAKEGETAHIWPFFLPGGKALLFTIGTGGSYDDARIAVFNLKTGEKRVLVEGGASPRYVPTGHLVYARAGSLFAVLFDLDKLQVRGSPVPVLEGVNWVSVVGLADFSFSNSGALVYAPGSAENGNSALVWVDRGGKAEPLPAPPRAYAAPRFSPDGRRVAISIAGSEGTDIWVYELERGTLTRLTFEGSNVAPAWTPDGRRITFTSVRSGKYGILWTPADGSGRPEELVAGQGPAFAGPWSPDGKTLPFIQPGPSGKQDIWLLAAPESATGMAASGEHKAQPFIQTQFQKGSPQISPDGKWIAYSSNESGRNEVYVQGFAGAPSAALPAGPSGGKWQISTDGGDYPRWPHSSRELFYRSGDKMMAAEVGTSPTFHAGTPKVLFEGRYQPGSYDVSPDGKRFVLVKAGESPATQAQVQVVMNWFDELERRVPPDGKR